MQSTAPHDQETSVNKGFSKQSSNYDQIDRENMLLAEMRSQVYAHVSRYIKSGSNILELNAGTGIDAAYFVSQGHTVHATDISDGMIAQLKEKANQSGVQKFTVQQLSYTQLNKIVSQKKFDYAFSNFGGLNCTPDLTRVTSNLKDLLTPGAFVTFVVMPRVCLWELAGIFKGKFKHAFRRWHNTGILAHVEGAYFKTYYHSLASVRNAFGTDFRFIESEGLAALTPQPHQNDFPDNHPLLYSLLKKVDSTCRRRFPFNKWGDHIIVTFQYSPRQIKT